MMAPKKASAWNFLRNQAMAAGFLAVEVLAALHIGFSHPLAWLLMVVATWNAALLLVGIVGVAMIAAETLNEEKAAK